MELLAKDEPFPHVLVARVLSTEGEALVLSRLKALEWTENSIGYFRFRTSANSDQLASVLILPAIKTMIDEIKTALELQLKIDLSSDVTLGAHLYDEHSVIGFHTDYSVTRDVRFVLNLNESWILSDGGEWALSKQPDLAEAVFLSPLSNTGYAFATNTHTFHALLTRHSNSLSYAIVASYPLL
jgi:Rps23 Pro-64 3,4-dihydroxylase Tpa1-like proline 4-hydroxylase